MSEEDEKRTTRITRITPEYRVRLRYGGGCGPHADEEELRELYEDLKELFEPEERSDV